MAYVSLYRKWRPQTFADVVGQTHVVRTLGNALAERRIAHAYLFTGPRGTGKTTVARLLAKGLNCVNGPTAEPCGVCSSCERIAQGMAMDVVEIDGASNRGIDEMRDVRERVRFAPSEGDYKVYIIDEVHMLTTEAFNALLKVLEEPPAHVVFVFATTEPHKIPTTVTSRCQRFDFRRLSADDARGRLEYVAKEEGIDVTPEALDLIVRYADGSLRDGLGILDQARAYADTVTDAVVTDVLGVAPREQIEAFTDVLAQRDTAGGLALVKDLQGAGRDLRQFMRDAARYLRDVLLYAAGGAEALAVAPAQEQLETLQRHADALSTGMLLKAIDELAEAEGAMRLAARSHLPLEMAVIRLTVSDVADRDGAGSSAGAHEAAASGQLGAVGAGFGGGSAVTAPAVDELLARIQRLEETVARLQTAGASPAVGERRPGAAAPAARPAPATPAPTRGAQAAGPTPATVGAGEGGAPVATDGPPMPGAAGSAGKSPERAFGGPASPDGPMDGDALTAVQAQWDNLLERLRQERALSVQAFLREGTPVAFVGEVLTIRFPSNRGFHRANVADPKNAKLIERLLRELIGRPVRIDPVLQGEEPAAPTAGTDPPAETAAASDPGKARRGNPAGEGSRETMRQDGGDAGGQGARREPSREELLAAAAENPLVKDALKLFGGKIVDVQPSAGPTPDGQKE